MEILGTTRLIALLGDPVAHSLSPAMHNSAFEQFGLDFAFVPLRVSAEGLKTAIDAIRVFNFRGANVTLPHKQSVIPFLDDITETSRIIGAVNTILNDDGRLIGTTTDPEGFLEGFREKGHSFIGKSVAILGNGGSARTIAYALLMQDRPSQVVLVGRDLGKSQRLATEIANRLHLHGGSGALPAPKAITMADYASVREDIQVVVNTTPVGMHPNTDATPLNAQDLVRGQIVYDIVYAPEQTRLLRDAEAMGLDTVGGLGMLVHQGRAAFEFWTGIKPDAAVFYAAAREKLARGIGEPRMKPPDREPAPHPRSAAVRNASPPPAGMGISDDP
ncbi:MAG: shikimate dehydrogenase [Fibrobacterota bacterium]|nr:shikimate dehydrogenase [Fibrobacterota bacterium]